MTQGVGPFGGERSTFGGVFRDDFGIYDLPDIAAAREIDVANFVSIYLESLGGNEFVACYAEDLAAAVILLTAGVGDSVIKRTSGGWIQIPTAGVTEKMFVASTGVLVSNDLQVIKTKGS